MKLNFAGSAEPKADEGFELLPNGKYHCQITSLEETETKGGDNPGTPMIKAEYTIITGKYENRRIWDNLVLNDNSLWKLKSLLYALGYTKDEVDDPAFEFDPSSTGLPGQQADLVGMELDVRVGRQPARDGYDARNKVNGYSAHMTTESDIIP